MTTAFELWAGDPLLECAPSLYLPRADRKILLLLAEIGKMFFSEGLGIMHGHRLLYVHRAGVLVHLWVD